MSIQVYVNFNGNCLEAVEFYARVFNTDLQQVMKFGDQPASPDFPVSEDAKNRVLHTFLMIGGSRVMFSDTFPGQPFIEGNNISLTYLSNDLNEIKTAFEGLRENGQVLMDLQETFWSKCYGMVVDKFGINWQISHSEE